MTSTMTRRLIGALGSTLLAVALTGCGGATASTAPNSSAATAPPVAATPASTPAAAPTAAPTTAPATTPGASLATTGRIELADKGFAVTLPDGWTRIDLQAGDLEAIMAAAGAADPVLAGAYSAQIQAMLAAGLVLFALGPDPAAGTTLTVLELPSGGMSLDLFEQVMTSQLGSQADGEIKTERVTLPAGDAIHFTYSLPAGAAPVPVSVDQYIVVTGAKALVISVSGAPSDAPVIAGSFETLD